MSINVLSLLRGTRNWDHSCISAPQLLGSKCIPVSLGRDRTILCPWHGHSKEGSLQLLTCPNCCACVRRDKSHLLSLSLDCRNRLTQYRHLELDQIISVFRGQACAKTRGQLDFESQTYLQKTHVSLEKAQGLIHRDNLGHGTAAAGGAQGPWEPGAPCITGWIMPVTQVLSSWLQASSNHVSRRLLAGTGFKTIQRSSVEWKGQIDSAVLKSVCFLVDVSWHWSCELDSVCLKSLNEIGLIFKNCCVLQQKPWAAGQDGSLCYFEHFSQTEVRPGKAPSLFCIALDDMFK